MGPSGISSQVTQGSQAGIKAPVGSCSARPSGAEGGRAALPGSRLSQPGGRLRNSWMLLHLENPHLGCWHRTPGFWGSLDPEPGEPKAVGTLDTPLALRAWHTDY